jgi:hypothetical protein
VCGGGNVVVIWKKGNIFLKLMGKPKKINILEGLGVDENKISHILMK